MIRMNYRLLKFAIGTVLVCLLVSGVYLVIAMFGLGSCRTIDTEQLYDAPDIKIELTEVSCDGIAKDISGEIYATRHGTKGLLMKYDPELDSHPSVAKD